MVPNKRAYRFRWKTRSQLRDSWTVSASTSSKADTPGRLRKITSISNGCETWDLQNAEIAAFGNTRRADAGCAEDVSMQALLESGAPITTIVGKASEYQVTVVLETSVEENLAMIADSVAYLNGHGRRVFYDAEHFFDGYKENPDYAVRCLRSAYNAGAERLVLCDTNGGTLPHEIGEIVGTVKRELPEDAVLGIHTHNDTDTAVASAMEAYRAGVHQIQGCINGYGERTGNANLVSVIGNLNLKMGVEAVKPEKLPELTGLSKLVSEIVNRRPFPFQPYVGVSAFTHKGGLHAAATEKSAAAYQHIDPDIVGNDTRVTISELSGRGNVMRLIRELGLEGEFTRDDARRIVEHIKQQESLGFAYENALASLELMILRNLPNYESPFELVDFMVIVENRRRASFGTGWRNDGSRASGALRSNRENSCRRGCVFGGRGRERPGGRLESRPSKSDFRQVPGSAQHQPHRL